MSKVIDKVVKQEFIKGREESIYESITHLDVSDFDAKVMKTIGKCKAQLGDYWSKHHSKVTCKKCLAKIGENK